MRQKVLLLPETKGVELRYARKLLTPGRPAN